MQPAGDAERPVRTNVIAAMMDMVPSRVPRMRALARRLRIQAAETGLPLYRRKMEELASELEVAAAEAERRQRSPQTFRLVN